MHDNIVPGFLFTWDLRVYFFSKRIKNSSSLQVLDLDITGGKVARYSKLNSLHTILTSNIF